MKGMCHCFCSKMDLDRIIEYVGGWGWGCWENPDSHILEQLGLVYTLNRSRLCADYFDNERGKYIQSHLICSTPAWNSNNPFRISPLTLVLWLRMCSFTANFAIIHLLYKSIRKSTPKTIKNNFVTTRKSSLNYQDFPRFIKLF